MRPRRDREPGAAAIREVLLPGVARPRLIAGAPGDRRGPIAAADTDPLYLDLMLPQGSQAEIPLPAGHAAFAYVFEGAAVIGADDKAVSKGFLAVLGPGALVRA